MSSTTTTPEPPKQNSAESDSLRTDPQPDPAVLSRFQLTRFLGWVCVVCVLLGAILRLTIRDRYRAPAVVFYVLSPASITLIAAAGVILFRMARSRRLTSLLAISALCCGTWTYGSMFHSNPTPSSQSESDFRVMFWNVCGGRLGWNGVLETIREEDPDVLVLAEIRFDVAYVDKELSNYPYHYKLPRAVRMYSRFPIGESKSHHRSWRGAFEQIEVLSPHGPFNLLVADLPSPPYYKRQEPIELLTEMGFDYLDKPAVIVGDMNTPVDSVFLERLRTEYSHAFETAGNGYHATWPMPLPVIAIDQMWINKLVKVSNCKVRWTVRSDHRPLIADLIVSSP